MAAATLLASVAFAAATAVVYFYVGYVFSQRRTTEIDRRAARMFVIWWYGLGATTVVTVIQTVSAVLGVSNLPFFIALTQVSLAVVTIALMGLLHYLVYLFTGRDVFWWLAVFYAFTYVTLVYYIQAQEPVGVIVRPWVVELQYARPQTGFFFIIVVALILLPQLFGAIAYFTLYFRVENRTQRYRIALVSWAIIVWFGSSLLAAASGLAQLDWWQVLSRSIGLTAVLVILAAYLPPAWVRRRFNIESIRGETTPR